MNCQQLVALITEYLEGTLSTEDRTQFEGHLSACVGCQQYLEQMRQTIRLTGTLRSEQIGDAARESLLAVFRAWRQSRGS